MRLVRTEVLSRVRQFLMNISVRTIHGTVCSFLITALIDTALLTQVLMLLFNATVKNTM